jgi:hypothetical protein
VDTPRPSPRTNRTRRVPHPVLIGHTASLSQERARANLERIDRERAKVASDKSRIKQRVVEERKYVQSIVDKFRATGKFQATGRAPPRMDTVSQLLVLSGGAPPVQEEDMNPDAIEVPQNGHVNGTVRKGQYAYYKFRHSNVQNRISIVCKQLKGDPDLFVGNHTCAYPTREGCVWKKAEHGDDKVRLRPPPPLRARPKPRASAGV